MEKTINIDQSVEDIKAVGEVRAWNIAKRDSLRFRGSKMKIRQFVRIVEKSLPQIITTATGDSTDHRANIIKAYCKAGLNGINEYEKVIWNIYNKAMIVTELNKLSTRAKNCLLVFYNVNEVESVSMDMLSLFDVTKFSEVKSAGKKVVEEVQNTIVRLLGK